jgi:hypothetical protein
MFASSRFETAFFRGAQIPSSFLTSFRNRVSVFVAIISSGDELAIL